MVCAAPLDLAAEQRDGCVSLIPEGVPSWGKPNDHWDRAYGHFGLPLPEDRVRLTRRKRIEFLPYFNAGFVMFPETPLAGAKRFPELWLDTALEVDHRLKVPKKRPWLDQICLPLTLKRFGIGYHVCPVDYNFSVSDRLPEPEARPRIVHYHRWHYLNPWPQHAAALESLELMAGPGLAGALMDEFGVIYHQTTPG